MGENLYSENKENGELVGHKRSIQISLSKYLFCLLMVMILGTLSFALHFQRSSDFNLKEGATDITMWLYLCLHKNRIFKRFPIKNDDRGECTFLSDGILVTRWRLFLMKDYNPFMTCVDVYRISRADKLLFINN